MLVFSFLLLTELVLSAFFLNKLSLVFFDSVFDACLGCSVSILMIVSFGRATYFLLIDCLVVSWSDSLSLLLELVGMFCGTCLEGLVGSSSIGMILSFGIEVLCDLLEGMVHSS